MERAKAYELVSKTIENANDLLVGSRHLWHDGRFAAGFSLFILACEEIGKAHSLFNYAMNQNASWDESTPWRGSDNHIKRLERYEIMTRFFLATQAIINRLESTNAMPQLDDQFSETLRAEVLSQSSNPDAIDWNSAEVRDQMISAVNDLIVRTVSPYKTDITEELWHHFGDPSGEDIKKVSKTLHKWRLKTMYVEEDGASPRDEWDALTKQFPDLLAAFESNGPFNMAQFHIEYLRDHTTEPYEKISTYLPDEETVRRLKVLWEKGAPPAVPEIDE